MRGWKNKRSSGILSYELNACIRVGIGGNLTENDVGGNLLHRVRTLDQNSIENGQKSTAQDDLELINCGITRSDSAQISIPNGSVVVEILECLSGTRT